MRWETLPLNYRGFPFYAVDFLSLIGLRIWLGGNLSRRAITACYVPVLVAYFVNGLS